MSAYLTFNLDNLTSDKFEELVNAILVNHFSPRVIPYGRPGKDGAIDAKLEGLPSTYGNLLNTPLEIVINNKKKHYYIFQAKHSRLEGYKERAKYIIKALKGEIKKLSTKRKKPTHYYLLTNINLRVSTRTHLEKLGKAFSYFECWDEAKINSFISGDIAIQRAFFPVDSIDRQLSSTLIEFKKIAKVFNKEVSSRKNLSTRIKTIGQPNSVKNSIRQLVEFELSFTKTTEALCQRFWIGKSPKDIPKEWVRIKIKAKKTGLVTLSKNRKYLDQFIDEINSKNVIILTWDRYIGEQVGRGDILLNFSCHPERKNDLNKIKDKIFDVIAGTNQVHIPVDEILKDFESKILTSIKGHRISEAQDQLSEFLSLRREYILQKRKYPHAFYPNMRTFGRRPIFGWDFVSLWEDVLENIADVAFAGEYPDKIRFQIIMMPINLCLDAIRTKQDDVRLKAELSAMWVIYRVIRKYKKKKYYEKYLEGLDHLYYEVSHLDYHIKSKKDAEWAADIAIVAAEHLAELGKLAIADDNLISDSNLLKFLTNCTAIDFRQLLSLGSMQSYKRSQKLYKTLSEKIKFKRREILYAWGTYAWHLERAKNGFVPLKPLTFLDQISVKECVELYSYAIQDKFENWLGWWFFPIERGAVWSGRVDHDVRESLQLKIVCARTQPEDFYNLTLLESESTYNEYLKELKALRERLESTHPGNIQNISKIEEDLNNGRLYVLDQQANRIRSQRFLSAKKLNEIRDSFNKEMNLKNPENVLFQVEEGIYKKDLFRVGVYTIYDKIWFLDETGYTGYSVTGMGSQWAASILNGRDQLLVNVAREECQVKEYRIDQIEELLKKIQTSYGQNHALLMSHRTVPWHLYHKYFRDEHQILSEGIERQAGRSGRLGALDVFYSGHLEPGEILIIPKKAFKWKIKKKLGMPAIDLIKPKSKVGNQIQKRYQDMDLSLKVLISAYENGKMVLAEKSSDVVLFSSDSDTVEEKT